MNELGEEEAMHLLTFSMEGVSFIRNEFMVYMKKAPLVATQQHCQLQQRKERT